MPIHLIAQDVITRGHDVAAAADALGWRLTEIRGLARLDEAPLAAIEDELARRGELPLVFCSLQLAARIRRRHRGLARGLFLPEPFLRWHRYTSVLPAELLLNADAVLLPWSRIPAMARRLHALFGEEIFIRPDSPMKPFTGFAVRAERLAQEHAALGQTESIDAGELCVIARARKLAAVEHRFWLIDGRISRAAPSGAAYGWMDDAEAGGPAPGAAIDLARQLARGLEQHDNLLVADIVVMDDGARETARLVELNAVSTSGWYRDTDPAALLRDISDLLVA